MTPTTNPAAPPASPGGTAVGIPAGGVIPTPGRRRPAGPQRCACSHGIGMHDIRGNGTRSACSVFTGPRGGHCGCKNYAAGDPA